MADALVSAGSVADATPNGKRRKNEAIPPSQQVASDALADQHGQG